MPNVRPINEKKYGISKHKFLQAYHFCLQYNEWKDELAYKTNAVKCAEVTGLPKGSSTGNCELVEQTCIEADPEIKQWLLKAVTNEHISYTYLKECMDIPCGKKMFYDRRRKFYWLLSQKI